MFVIENALFLMWGVYRCSLRCLNGHSSLLGCLPRLSSESFMVATSTYGDITCISSCNRRSKFTRKLWRCSWPQCWCCSAPLWTSYRRRTQPRSLQNQSTSRRLDAVTTPVARDQMCLNRLLLWRSYWIYQNCELISRCRLETCFSTSIIFRSCLLWEVLITYFSQIFSFTDLTKKFVSIKAIEVKANVFLPA